MLGFSLDVCSLGLLPARRTLRERPNHGRDCPTLLSARAAGVAYSHHPLTGAPNDVVINAVLGLAEPLVSGAISPDCYIVRIKSGSESPHMFERHVVPKFTARQPTADAVHDTAVPAGEQDQPSLADEAFALAHLIKQVERAMNHPVDVEWAADERSIWLLQARPIPKSLSQIALSEATCAWSRANSLGTLPTSRVPGVVFSSAVYGDEHPTSLRPAWMFHPRYLFGAHYPWATVYQCDTVPILHGATWR